MSRKPPPVAEEIDQQGSFSPSASFEEYPHERTYVSPASSTSDAFHHQQMPPVAPVMNTINNVRKNSSGSEKKLAPHPHPFFNSFYDSDASDGSIVFSYGNPGLNAARDHGKRDRFPSFDSMASTGSVHRVSTNSVPLAPPPFPPQKNTSNPQILPYDQRRKLMQQRQQQVPQRQESPRTSPGRPMHFLPSPEHMPIVYQIGGPIPPPPIPNLPPGSLQMHPMVAIPGQPPYPPYLPQQIPVPTGMPPHFFPQQQQQQMRQYSPRSRPQAKNGGGRPPTAQLPPSGVQRNNTAMGSRNRTLSQDSSTSAEQQPRRPQRVRRQTTPPSELPPPPPSYPPPPLPPTHHVRSESTGSVSSLGSPKEDEDHEDQTASRHEQPPPAPPRHHRQDSGARNSSNSFLQLLNPWSPKTQRATSPNVDDFHSRNQAFLQRTSAERQAAQRKYSPLQAQHRRVGSSEYPPVSHGTHRRLKSIDNDVWDEEETSERETTGETTGDTTGDTTGFSDQPAKKSVRRHREPMFLGPNKRGTPSSTSVVSSSDTTYDEGGNDSEEANERTSLLPPSGISTYEAGDKKNSRRSRTQSKKTRRTRYDEEQPEASPLEDTVRFNNTSAAAALFNQQAKRKKSKKKKKKSRSRRTRYIYGDDDDSDGSIDASENTSGSPYDYRKWTRKRARMLEKERAKLIEQWKEEARAEAEMIRRQQEENRWYRRLNRFMTSELGSVWQKAFKILASLETFICNLPLTTGAIAMAIVTLGVVWFKFGEENLSSCQPVHFHSSQCTFPEFPGCFYCDKEARMYKVAVDFHFACSIFAGVLSLIFVAKVVLASRVVFDELSSPTTSSPAGLLCMTTVCVFAGRGVIGQFLVSAAASIHLCLVIWYIYMALAYHILPEPSWFPNTVGIGLSAVKTWLYYPMPGHFLMAISLALNFFFFPISLIRVALNEKISAPVGWMQMSAPAISLYALTIMAQPSFEEEHPDINSFQKIHRMIYLPCMHFLFVLSVIGFVSSAHSLAVRWDDFKTKEFSPAHAAFCFPTLSHANAIQAYRGAVNSFSDIPPGSPFKIVLYTYWVIILVGGTIATFWITTKFLYHLPSWTNLDLTDEDEPPAPYETMMTTQNVITAGETFRQPFVSPAVLQANETGALVMVARSGQGQQFVRTRRLPALGFEPTMKWSEIQRERELLLEWVGKNPPKRRHRTLSVPGIDFSYGANTFGTGNSGVYAGYGSPLSPGTYGYSPGAPLGRARASTLNG